MHLIAYNFSWMTWNIFLAVLPVGFGWVFFLVKNKIWKIILGLLWLAFLPNSIYLFTDLINLMKQWVRVGTPEKLVLIFQYGILVFVGYITFILCMYPFELYLRKSKWVKDKGGVDKFLVVLNFIIGFGITLGRVERVNSWEVVAAPLIVIEASFRILFTPELIILTLLFGLFANLFYFLFRRGTIKYFKTYLNQVGFLQ